MGTNYIAPTWRMPENTNKDKLSNYSIDFTGSEHITCDVISQLANKTQATWSGWFNRGNTGSYYIMGSWGTSGTDRQFLVLQTPTRLAVYMGLGQYGNQRTMFDSNSLTFTTGVWYHLMFVYDESEVSNADKMKVYINNVAQTNESVGNAINFVNPVTSPFIIGTIGGYLTNKFQGQISQVYIFDYALSADQRSYLYNLNNPMAISGAEPVAYWPLGDNSNPHITAGYPNISVGADSVFDFSSDYINLDPSIVKDFDNDNFSISAWVNGDAFSGYNYIFQDGATSNNRTIQLLNYTVRGGLEFAYGNVTLYRTSPNIALDTGRWYHVVATYSSVDGAKVYIDGNTTPAATNTNTIALDRSSHSKAGIGAYVVAGTSNYWNGKISNMQIWNSVLGTSDVTTLYNNGQPLMTGVQPQENNLRAWYKLNQSANWEADTAGNWQIPDAVSSYPQSFDFIPNNLILFSKNDSYKLQEFSVSLWFKPDVNASDPIFLNGSYGLGSKGFEIFQYFGSIRVRINAPGNNQVIGGLTIGKWHHIFVSYDGTTMKYSVNGEAIQTGTLTGGAVDYDSYTGIAVGRSVYGYTDGKISNVMVWNSDISASSSLTYNNGIPLTTAIASDNLKGWWKLDNTELFDGNNWSLNNQKYPANYTSALYFTGGAGNEHLDTPSNSDLLMAGSHTFSLWLYVDFNQIDSTNYIFDKSGLDYSLGLSGNALRLIYYNYYDSGGASGNNKIIVLDSDWKTTYQKAWHHIFVSVDQPNLTVTLITDGTDISTHALPADYVSPDQGAGALNIMSYNGATLSLAGFISNLAFFNGTALTNSQALTLYNNGTPENNISFSPTSWWKIDNTSTGLLDNAGSANLTNTGGVERNIFVSAEAGVSSGMTEQNLVNNNVSVLNGESVSMDTTNLVQSNLTRKKPFSNYSIRFDANSGDFAATQSGIDSILSGATSFTISSWINFNDASALRPIATNWVSASTSYNYIFRYYQSQIQFYVRANGSTGNATYSFTPDLNRWYNIVGTWNGSGGPINIYIDGIAGGVQGTRSGTMPTITTPESFGRYVSSVNYYHDGKLCNIAYWKNQLLTQNDILNLYNNGISQDLNNFRITPTNWYPMDESYTYFNGTTLILRDAISGRDATGYNINQENILGNAPSSESSGVGSNLTIADLKGNMYNSVNNAHSINMADYADGVTNPANSGRSTNVP